MLEGVQLSIEDAIASGRAGMQRAQDAAERRDPFFTGKAQESIVAHLRAAPGRQACGEELVDAAIAAGACPPDARAFGGVFQALSRRGVIRCVSYCLRRKGNSTAGGRVWELCS